MESKTIGYIQIGIIAIISLVGLYFFYDIASDTKEATGTGMIKFTYFMLGITLFAALVVWILDIISDVDKLKRFGISLGVFLLVLLGSYFAADGGEYKLGKLAVDDSTSKWIDTGLSMFYVLVILAILLMIFSPVITTLVSGSKKQQVEEIVEEEIEEE